MFFVCILMRRRLHRFEILVEWWLGRHVARRICYVPCLEFNLENQIWFLFAYWWGEEMVYESLTLCTAVNTVGCCLTHWGRVTHICVSDLTIIGSDSGLSPGRRQAIIRTNARILLTHLGLVSHICVMKNSPHFPSDAYMGRKYLYFSYKSRGRPTKQCQAKMS